MIIHAWSVLCMMSVTDKDSNLISLLNSLEELRLDEGQFTPENVLPIGCELVSLWARDPIDQPATGSSRVSLVAPSGTVLIPVETKIDLTQYERLRARRAFRGLRLPEVGRYVFLVEFQNEGDTQWTEAARVPLVVKLDTPNAIAQGAAEENAPAQ